MLNEAYLRKTTVGGIQKAFDASKELPSIVLQRFFDEKAYAKIALLCKRASFKKSMERMHHSYAVAPMPREVEKFLNNEEVLRFISKIVGKNIKSVNGCLYMFGWKDYTLLHDKKKEKPGIGIIFDMTGKWPNRAGGKIVHVDGTGSYHRIPASENAVVVTKRKEGIQKFMQYINHVAGKKKRLLFMGTAI